MTYAITYDIFTYNYIYDMYIISNSLFFSIFNNLLNTKVILLMEDKFENTDKQKETKRN